MKTVKDQRRFQRAYKEGKGNHTKFFVCFYLPSESLEVGFVASKKVGNAVERNLAKRRMRALMRDVLNRIPTGIYVIVAKKSILHAPYDELEREIHSTIRRIKRFTKADPC